MNRRCPEHIVVGEASDGASAFDLVCELQPDLLITDMKMPKMDGIQLIKKLRQSQKENVQIIVLSGYDDYEYIRQSMKNKAEDYLFKAGGRRGTGEPDPKDRAGAGESGANEGYRTAPDRCGRTKEREGPAQSCGRRFRRYAGLGLKDFFTGSSVSTPLILCRRLRCRII